MLKFHKKTLSIVLVGMLAAGTLGTVAAVAGGDINSDGKVDASDARAIIEYFTGKSANANNTDANGDGKVNVADVCTVKNNVLNGKSSVVQPGSIPDFGTAMHANATMVSDFRTGKAGDFFASDGWTNGKPFDCWWYKQNAQIKGDHLELSVDKKWTNDSNPDWNPAYSGGEFRTNEFYGYGYYETSMKAIKNDGVVSSFFTYTGPSDDNPWDEIDIEVLGKDTTKVQLNYYTNGTGNHEKMIDLGFDASEGYHTYGFDWQPGKITWYVDGKKVHEATQNIPVTPGKIMMNAWPGKTVDDWLKAYNGNTPLTAYYQWVTYEKSANAQNPQPTVQPTVQPTTQPTQNNGSLKDYGTPMDTSATMISDFRTGKAGDFFASDGWTNGKPFDCWWYKQNAQIKGDHLELSVDKKWTNDSNPDWNPAYSGGEFRTNEFYGYGYYETSMQAIKNDGVVSSFFTYTGPSDDNPWDEIDIEVLGKDTTKVQLNYYTNGTGNHEKMIDLGFDASEGYHTYGFDWQPGKITWYVDGKKVHEAAQNIPVTPGKIMMNAWPGKTVDDWLKAFNGKTPLTARYQWVTYKKSGNSQNPNQGQNQNPNQNPNQGQNQNPNQGQSQGGKGTFNASATMVSDFRTGKAGDFFASDGWTNGKPFDCWWYKQNAVINGNHLELKIDKKYGNDSNPDWNPQYSGGEFRTNKFYGYGYYETSMKAIKNDGVVSSFFTYTGPSDNNPWDEIDVEVLGKDTTKVQFNYYTNGKGDHEYMYDLGFDASQGYHTYGFDWQPGKITWYVDGKKAYEATQNIPTTPGKIMMNAWPGKTVDDWLKAFNGKTPLTAYYEWVTYNK